MAAVQYMSEKIEDAFQGKLVTERNLVEITTYYRKAMIKALHELSYDAYKLWDLLWVSSLSPVLTEPQFYKELGFIQSEYQKAKQELILKGYLRQVTSYDLAYWFLPDTTEEFKKAVMFAFR